MDPDTLIATGGFKVGDKVSCIDTSETNLSSKNIYTISEIRNHGRVYIVVDNDNRGWYPERFKLVEEKENTMEYREGDIIHIRAKVSSTWNRAAHLLGEGGKLTGITINLNDHPPVHVEPRPLSVSDTVRVKGNSLNLDYKILSIVDGSAWIKSETDVQGSIVSINELKRID